MGFDIAYKSKLTARRAAILNKTEADLPTSSGIAKADDIDLENIASSASKSTSDLITVLKDSKQTSTDDLFEHPLHELLGLDRTMKTIRGTLMTEVAKKVELSEHIDRERRKLAEIENDTSYTDDQREEIRERIRRLNDELNIRQESIDLLKGRLSNQITAVKETIAKVLDKDTSLAEKIRILFREQGITIASILTAIGMAIGVLVEACCLAEAAPQFKFPMEVKLQTKIMLASGSEINSELWQIYLEN